MKGIVKSFNKISRNFKNNELIDITKNFQYFFLFCDGGCRGNPGPSGIGAVLYSKFPGKGMKEIDSRSTFIGKNTSSASEYHSLIHGLKMCEENGIKDVNIRMDSKVIVLITNGRSKARKSSIVNLAKEVKSLLSKFRSWNIVHVPRKKNTRADQLANEAMDYTNY